MKKFKKILACVIAVSTLATLMISPMSANAIAILLGYYPDGTEIYGGIYSELVGFDEDGNPIIVENIPDGVEVIPTSAVAIGESDSEDSITEFTVGDSVYPRGDINLDGKANTADLLYLKKYLLGLIEW
ncbi:MAG: hypothetical protein LUG94_01355 [Ruminococcus sp.]|nr:hypothetical protein [Ruminococcus sp.]